MKPQLKNEVFIGMRGPKVIADRMKKAKKLMAKQYPDSKITLNFVYLAAIESFLETLGV